MEGKGERGNWNGLWLVSYSIIFFFPICHGMESAFENLLKKRSFGWRQKFRLGILTNFERD